MKDRLISTLTFCKRLGKLVLGFDLVKNAMQLGEAKAVLLASDLSPKTQKEASYLCQMFQIPLYQTELTMDEIWYLVKKRAGILAVTDEGFARKLGDLLGNETGLAASPRSVIQPESHR